MKEYIKKFNDLSSADKYVMRDVPFIGTIVNNQNIANDKIDRQITVENNTVTIPNTIILPDNVLQFYYGNRLVVYRSAILYNMNRYPEYNNILEAQYEYTPLEWAKLHVIHEDGTEEIIDYNTSGGFISYLAWTNPNMTEDPATLFIPHTKKFWLEIIVPNTYIPGGWYAKSNIIKPYYPPGHDYWNYFLKDDE